MASQVEMVLRVEGLDVLFVRKPRMRNARLRVADDGRVVISAPFGYSQRRAFELVKANLPWILNQQRKLAESPKGHAANASVEEQRAWKEVVSACVPPLVKAWEPIMGVKVGTLAYRNMKSRWGSCQPATGRICINTRLALYPPECLEYVVVHELCHLLEPSHGPRFHALMDTFMPDWKQRKEKLKS